jgi:oligoendopeptidase F
MKRTSIWEEFLAFSVATLLLNAHATAQMNLDTSRISQSLYFDSDAAESSSRHDLHARLPELIRSLMSTPDHAIEPELARIEAFQVSVQRHAAYFKVKTLEDTKDAEARAARDEISADQDTLDAAVTLRLRQLPKSVGESLGKYALLARMSRMEGFHSLHPEAERYRGSVVAPVESAIADARDEIENRIKKPSELKSADTPARRAAIAAWNASYQGVAAEESELLAVLVDIENRDAVAQGYRNAADRKYQELGLSESLVRSTLAAVQNQAPTYRRYQEVVARHAAKRLAVPFVVSSEVGLAMTACPSVPPNGAMKFILESLQPLGDDYVTRFARLLDPANGRLDLMGGANRANAGTSIVAYDGPTALYFTGYDGSLRQLGTIAHEGGHAIHRELMNASSIPVYQRSGPSYLFEGFAILNELLLLDHAARIAKTPSDKQCALEHFLSKVTLELFVSAEEASFEMQLYEAAFGKSLLDRDKIDALYQASIAPYETWSTDGAGLSRGWMTKKLVFEDPLYLVNYLYASAIAVCLYDKLESDPSFGPMYATLLRRGFDKEPKDLLADFGIRFDSPEVFARAARLVEEKTRELERLYADGDMR